MDKKTSVAVLTADLSVVPVEEKKKSSVFDISLLESKDHIDIWRKTEDVAMHFNELLLGFRLKAVGALSLAAGGLLALSSRNSAIVLAEAKPSFFAGGLAFIFFTWCGFFAIDRWYYQKLLVGAVSEAMRLEEVSNGCLNLSTRISQCFAPRNASHPWAILLFYLMPWVGVIAWVACIPLLPSFGPK